MVINRLLTSVYVLVNGIVFNRFSMFDELKEVKYFREITDFKSLNLRHIKEIKHLKSLEKAEAYLEPKRASTMELFFWNGLNGLLFSQ